MEEPLDGALCAFIRSFAPPGQQGQEPWCGVTSLDSLTNGVVLFSAWRMISPDGPTTGSLWDLWEELVDFGAEWLKLDFGPKHSANRLHVREPSAGVQVRQLLTHLLCCAVHCNRRAEVVGQILGLEEAHQLELKLRIEELMGSLPPVAESSETSSPLGRRALVSGLHSCQSPEGHTATHPSAEHLMGYADLRRQHGELMDQMGEALQRVEALEGEKGELKMKCEAMEIELRVKGEAVLRMQANSAQAASRESESDEAIRSLQRALAEKERLLQQERARAADSSELQRLCDEAQAEAAEAREELKRAEAKLMELASLRRQLKEVDVSRAAELEERMELEERARALPALRKELAAARQQLASATDQPDGCPLVLPSSSEQVTPLLDQQARLKAEVAGVRDEQIVELETQAEAERVRAKSLTTQLEEEHSKTRVLDDRR
mmetsp:Transcript_46610/g.105092  ORF Transcript_46610/g.105092 Transcript_46610/m.105092 type:complete len:437 (+) Transcript_46610:16-1326(+)